ncbi:MAG: 2-dehydro-3-deoxygalactonokinase [Arcticibacterium sp.]|jgi:2-dehydro-3-deoxygalactonokinase
MNLPQFFISCDWGTSNFRLRLVNTQSLEVLRELKSENGVKNLNQSLKKTDRLGHFTAFLAGQISLLPEEHRNHLIVISGMASSTIGMLELPYAQMPFSSQGDGIISESIKTERGLKLILISGVKSEVSVMRGEEIQAVGLAKEFGDLDSGLLILPGTHSKHLTFEKGSYTAMKTFMTGELFQIISEHSILSGSVLKSDWSRINEAAFLEGVALGIQKKLSEYLFSVRVRDITQSASKEANYLFLSGLLIGDELSYLKNNPSKIILAAAEPVFDLYKLALAQIKVTEDMIFCDSSIIQSALLVGHKKILIQYVNVK